MLTQTPTWGLVRTLDFVYPGRLCLQKAGRSLPAELLNEALRNIGHTDLYDAVSGSLRGVILHMGI